MSHSFYDHDLALPRKLLPRTDNFLSEVLEGSFGNGFGILRCGARRALTGSEIPAIVPNPDPNPFVLRRISVDDIPPPCISHPLPPFSASLNQVTQMKAPIVMIPLSIQVLSELPGTGHRSSKGCIYRPHEDSPEVIRHFRECVHARGDMPIQSIINLVHHLVQPQGTGRPILRPRKRLDLSPLLYRS